MPNTRLRPIAPPTTSATSVAIATTSAWIQRKTLTPVGYRSRHSSGRLRWVTRPSFEVEYWINIPARLATTMTQTRR